jgi:hypothetical protein
VSQAVRPSRVQLVVGSRRSTERAKEKKEERRKDRANKNSESSLFVAPHLLILKTCGTTLNLLGLHRIIEIAREYCGLRTVWRCFYSRKSFFFPERQQGVHRDWRDEVGFLDTVFGESSLLFFFLTFLSFSFIVPYTATSLSFGSLDWFGLVTRPGGPSSSLLPQ